MLLIRKPNATFSFYFQLLYQEPDTGLTIESQSEEAGNKLSWSRLTIEAVDDSDSGWYQCQFANELASVMSEKAFLVVLGKGIFARFFFLFFAYFSTMPN